jgi:hypothetical protein
VIPIPLLCNAVLERELSELKDTAQYVMDLYVPQEGAEPKPLVDRLDEAEGRIKGLLLDTTHLVDLSGLIRCEHIVAAAGEVVNKFDFGTD